ncbi:MAG: hypothetical protein L6275_01700 [Candidatus Portnoybacteria bacterium]|nr:hypothetical protein [Candidatus Portnoybacteria bacterium]
MKNYKQQKGIGMIEVIVSLAVITTAFWGFLELAKFGLKIQEESQAKIEASGLASETIEAVRAARDENWDNLANLSFETRYYPIISENKWTLTPTNPGPINGIYDRWFVLERVYRDANDNIGSLGAEDFLTKKITATVEWNNREKTEQINLTTYLTNWK